MAEEVEPVATSDHDQGGGPPHRFKIMDFRFGGALRPGQAELFGEVHVGQGVPGVKSDGGAELLHGLEAPRRGEGRNFLLAGQPDVGGPEGHAVGKVRRIQFGGPAMRRQGPEKITDMRAAHALLIGQFSRSGPPSEPEGPAGPDRRRQRQRALQPGQAPAAAAVSLEPGIRQQPEKGRHQQGVGRDVQVEVDRGMGHVREKRRDRAQRQRQAVAEQITGPLVPDIPVPLQKPQAVAEVGEQQKHPEPESHRPVIAEQLRIIVVRNVRVHRLGPGPRIVVTREFARIDAVGARPGAPDRRGPPLVKRQLGIGQPELPVPEHPATRAVRLAQKIPAQENQKGAQQREECAESHQIFPELRPEKLAEKPQAQHPEGRQPDAGTGQTGPRIRQRQHHQPEHQRKQRHHPPDQLDPRKQRKRRQKIQAALEESRQMVLAVEKTAGIRRPLGACIPQPVIRRPGAVVLRLVDADAEVDQDEHPQRHHEPATVPRMLDVQREQGVTDQTRRQRQQVLPRQILDRRKPRPRGNIHREEQRREQAQRARRKPESLAPPTQRQHPAHRHHQIRRPLERQLGPRPERGQKPVAEQKNREKKRLHHKT